MTDAKLTDGQITVLVAQKIVARCTELAGEADAGRIVLSAALFGATVRMEFEAEMQRRFKPGGTGGVVFPDEMTDLMIASPPMCVWTDLSKGLGVAIDAGTIAEKRALVGTRSPFPIVPIKGLSFDYDGWIEPRLQRLLPEFKTLFERLGRPLQMFPALTLATRSLISIVKLPTQAELAILALDVMLGVARIPVGAKLQLVPSASQPILSSRPVPPPPPQSGWRSFFGQRQS